MILMVQPLAAGNALRVLMNPPSGASRIRLLRKSANTFTGPDDPDALLIADGLEKCVTDISGLLNGESVWYCAYYLVGATWIDSAPSQGVAAATFESVGPNVQSLVRDRLELGLKVYVDRGQLTHSRGFIPTLMASPQIDDVPLPLVTVHLANDAPDMRFIGEMVGSDTFDPLADEWSSFEGGIGKTDLTIVGWSLNSDERITLREAIKSVLQANLPIFDSAGLLLISWNFTDTEDFERYQAPIYQVACQFTCYAPSAVKGVDPAVHEVVINNLGLLTNG